MRYALYVNNPIKQKLSWQLTRMSHPELAKDPVVTGTHFLLRLDYLLP